MVAGIRFTGRLANPDRQNYGDIMTGKRFILIDGVPPGTHTNIWDKLKRHNQGIGDELLLGEAIAMLNEGVQLAEENKELKELIEYKNKTQEDCLNRMREAQKERADIKQAIKEAYNNERTHSGTKALRQLAERIGMIL